MVQTADDAVVEKLFFVILNNKNVIKIISV